MPPRPICCSILYPAKFCPAASSTLTASLLHWPAQPRKRTIRTLSPELTRWGFPTQDWQAADAYCQRRCDGFGVWLRRRPSSERSTAGGTRTETRRHEGPDGQWSTDRRLISASGVSRVQERPVRTRNDPVWGAGKASRTRGFGEVLR